MGDLALAGAAGVALGAPLALPALQLAGHSFDTLAPVFRSRTTAQANISIVGSKCAR